MDLLPSELLADIFSFLDIGQLFEVRQVCLRWQEIVDECPSVWTGRRRITKCDLGPYSSPETQVDRLMYLFEKLETIEYFFFPVLLDRSKIALWRVYGFTTEMEECLRRLLVALKQLFHAGRIPVHVEAVNFMANMIGQCGYLKTKPIKPLVWTEELSEPSRLEPHCSFSKCTTIIVPSWSADDVHTSSYPAGVEYLLGQMAANLKEIVIEDMVAFSYASDGWTQPRPRTVPRQAAYVPSTIRLLQVTEDGRGCLPTATVRLRRECEVFTFSEFTRFIHQCAEGSVSFEALNRRLEVEGRVQDSQVTFRDKSKFGYIMDCLLEKRPYNEGDGAALQRRASSTITSLTVCVDLRRRGPPSKTLDFLRADSLRDVTQLDIELTRDCDRRGRQNNSPTALDAHLLRTWSSLLKEDIITRLEFLRVSLDVPPSSRVLAAPATTLALPLLRSLELIEASSMVHVCSLLNAAPNLRHLRLRMRGLDATRAEEEHVEFRDQLLSAISELTGLVALGIELNEPDNSNVKWLDAWTTYVEAKRSRILHCAHLREPVFDALSKLVNLDMLVIDFFRTNGQSVFYMPTSLQKDIRRLTSMLPRLRFVVLCSHLPAREATSC